MTKIIKLNRASYLTYKFTVEKTGEGKQSFAGSFIVESVRAKSLDDAAAIVEDMYGDESVKIYFIKRKNWKDYKKAKNGRWVFSKK
jgi:hypothetical protein